MVQVLYTDEIPQVMKDAAPKAIYVYSGVNSDSKSVGVPATFEGIDQVFTLPRVGLLIIFTPNVDGSVSDRRGVNKGVQGYLAHEKHPPRRTLQ